MIASKTAQQQEEEKDEEEEFLQRTELLTKKDGIDEIA